MLYREPELGLSEIRAATDGSSLGNPGPAAWAWYVDEQHWQVGGWPLATNNQAELTAVLELLRATETECDRPLLVLADSRYVIDSLTKWLPGWKRKNWRTASGSAVKNQELIQALDKALEGRQVRFEWVRGHQGHPLNEQADGLAHAAARAYQESLRPTSGPGW